MEAIKLFDDVLASWQNDEVADIELDARYKAVFNAYLSSKDGENEMLTFRDIVYHDFETNMGNLHDALLELGIKQSIQKIILMDIVIHSFMYTYLKMVIIKSIMVIQLAVAVGIV